MPPPPATLDAETLTLATAHRQWLAARVDADAEQVATHLLGLQAQEPFEPYVGVFSRTRDADPADLAGALLERRVARTHVMRRTVHLHPRADALLLRALHDDMLRQRSGHVLAQVRDAAGARVAVDAVALAEATAPLFDAGPRRLRDVGREVSPLFPGAPPSSLGDAACSLTPVLQTTPRAVWGARGPATYTT